MAITPYTIRPNELDQYHRKILHQGLTNQKFPEHEFNQLTLEMRDLLSRNRCLPAATGQTCSSAPSMAMKILKSLCRIIDKSQLPGPGRGAPAICHHGMLTPKEKIQDTHPALRNSPILKLTRSTLVNELKPGPAEESTRGNSVAGERDTVTGLIRNPRPGRAPPHILASRNAESQRYDWSKCNPDAPDDDINVWKIADQAAAMKSESDISWEPCTQYSESSSGAIPPFFLSVESIGIDDGGKLITYGKRRESTIHGGDEDPVTHSDKGSLAGGNEHEAVPADEEESYSDGVSCREDELEDCPAGEGVQKGEGGDSDDSWARSSQSSFASTVHPSSSVSVADSEYGPESEDEMYTGPKPVVGGGGGQPGVLRRKKLRIRQWSRPCDPPDLLFSGPNLPPSPSPPRVGFASHPPLSRSAYRGGRSHSARGARGCDQCAETTASTPCFPYEMSDAPWGEARRNSLKSKYFT